MVPSSVLAGLAVAAVLAAVWPLAIFLICRHRMKLLGWNIFVGTGIFILFSQVLEKALHAYLLKTNEVTAGWLHLHPIGFAAYGAAAAALFEEVGRFIGMRFFVRSSGNPGTAVAYGIGHGGIEAILIGSIASIEALVFAGMLNAGRLDQAVGPALGPEALAQLRANLEHLTIAGIAMGSFERLTALLIQIGLSLTVWKAVETGRFGWLLLAILLHAAIDFPVGLVQAGQLPLLRAEMLLFAVGVALGVFFLSRLPSKTTAWAVNERAIN